MKINSLVHYSENFATEPNYGYINVINPMKTLISTSINQKTQEHVYKMSILI